MTKICFIGNLSSSFIKNDYEILKKYFNVDIVQPPKTRIGWLKYPFLIAKKIWHSNISFSWFAGWHSLFPVIISKLFRKKSVVVVGGYDAAYVPEINYGAFTNWKERIPARYVLKHADLLLPVSKFTKDEITEKVRAKRIKLIYNGVDVKKFKPAQKKENNLVITVGALNQSNLKRKGIETFVKTASSLPGIRFVVIGKCKDNSIDYLKSINPPNVEFTGFVSDKDLIEWYQRAKVVCQLSYYEAFGMTPAEGMACGCIPIVTRERAGLPEFVKDTGFYVPYGDEKATAKAVKEALNTSDELGARAKERILRYFSLGKRGKELIKLIKS